MSAFRLATCGLCFTRLSMKSPPSPRAHSEALVHAPHFAGQNSSLFPQSRDSILMSSCCSSPHEVPSCKSPHFAGKILHCSRILGAVF